MAEVLRQRWQHSQPNYAGQKTLRKHDPFVRRRGNTARRLSRRRRARAIRNITAQVDAAMSRKKHVAAVVEPLCNDLMSRKKHAAVVEQLRNDFDEPRVLKHTNMSRSGDSDKKWREVQAENERKRRQALAKLRTTARQRLLTSLRNSSMHAVHGQLAERMGEKVEAESADCGILLDMALLPDPSHCIQRFTALCSARRVSYSLVWHSTAGKHKVRAITARGLNISTTNTVLYCDGVNYGPGMTFLSFQCDKDDIRTDDFPSVLLV
jgi:hypothetical protein